MSGQLERCEREWHELEGEFQELQETHRIYKQKLEELTSLQTLCSTSISKQKRHLKDLKHTLQRYKRHSSHEEAALIQQMTANIKERQNVFFDMEAYLPKKNGLYLNLVLGNVSVTLLSNQAKFAYKDEYEKFKLYLTIILLLGAVACRFVLHYRVTDEVFNFLLVWYYCTLTIRESILISNGSRIKGWWVSHHYVSTFLSGVMLTWPNGLIYQKFRNQFLAFSIFQSCVQFLQYYYQRGCLYRLRALGERNHLDLTVEGFQSWMWRGLTFLLPFLFCGHFWQLYNAVTLFELSTHEECKEWQVFVLALTFLILFPHKEALQRCQKAGGTVLSILDEMENVFVWEHLQTAEAQSRGAWLGMNFNPKGGTLVWQDNTAVNYSNWGPPGLGPSMLSHNSCYWIQSSSGLWRPGACTNITMGVVCKLPRVEENSFLPSAALPESPVALVVVLTAVLLLLALMTAALILYRRRQSAERGSFEGARYSRSSHSGPAEATEKNILVSDMEMNEQQE